MGKIAAVFPGQGSQREGMGKDFYESFPTARAIYDAANETLGVDIQAISFSEEDERLHLTEFTQPAILTNEIAIYATLWEEKGLRANLFGGHSLGEYSALVAAGALQFKDALRIVRKRGALMQQAVPMGEGAMSALKMEQLLMHDFGTIVHDCNVDVANYNSSSQIVISGLIGNIQEAERRFTAKFPGMEIFRLPVSAPFHSRLMKEIENEFSDYIKQFRIDTTLVHTVLSNFTGVYHYGKDTYEHLIQQVSNPVKWTENMRIINQKSSFVLEVGPGKPLGGFFYKDGYNPPPSVVTTRCMKKLVLPETSKISA